MAPLNLFFDIDGTLVLDSTSTVKHASFFLRKGLILTAYKTYYIFPGVIELLQLVFSLSNVNVFFFSAGHIKRNKILIKQLLKHALGKEHYEEVKKKRIFSHCDLTVEVPTQRALQFQSYGLMQSSFSYGKKDISKGLKRKDKIENAILIEDNSNYVLYGQEKNLLKVHSTSGREFEALEHSAHTYDADGYKKIDCFLVDEGLTLEGEIKAVGTSEKILVIRKKEEYAIGFLNQLTHQYEQKIISKDNYPQLIEALKAQPANSCIGDPKLLESIYKIVVASEGKTKKLCYEVNQIYYLAGMLFTAIEKTHKEKISISEALFQLQYKAKGEAYSPKFEQSASCDKIYHLGLEKLRQVKHQLAFTTPSNYLQCISCALTDEEKQFLEEGLALNRTPYTNHCAIL
jgi:hypothetical protein